MRLQQIMECMNDALDANQPAIIWGMRGCGKSQGIKQLAKRRGARLIEIRLSDRDAIDFSGIPAREGNSTVWLRPAFLPALDETGEIILFLDEADRPSSLNVFNLAMQLVLDRRVAGHELGANVRILAAGNGKTDKGTVKFGNALANRFMHFFLDYDAAETRAYFSQIGVAPEIIAFLARHPEHANAMPKGDELAAPSPRQWEAFNGLFNSPRRFAHCAALLGDNVATDFRAFMETFGKLPPLAEILANPTGARLPDMSDASLCFAVAAALARVADRSNIGAVYAYLKRLPRDLEVMAILYAKNRDASLINTAAYVEFAQRNQDVAQ